MEQITSKEPGKEAHERIFEILFDKDEITWQTIIHELVNTGQIEPWDVDISQLTKKYIEVIKKLKQLDFRVSGKVLLAAAILLKIKSNRLVGEDIDYLDKIISDQEEDLLSFEENLEPRPQEQIPKNLIPRTPQPRKRKVSIYDLMGALERALEVKRRRVLRSIPPMHIQIPEKKRDISSVIKDIYQKIKIFFWEHKKERLTFSQLVPSQNKADKVYTFVPLLHLTNQRKIDLFQQQHFGEIDIVLKQIDEEVNKELGMSS